MTNKQNIEYLKKELRRYQEKLGQMNREREELLKKVDGVGEIMQTFDAWIIQVAISYGDNMKDEDTGKDIPRMKSLHVPIPKVKKLLTDYEIQRRIDKKDGSLWIAVGLKDDPNDHKTDSQLEKEALSVGNDGK